MNLQREATPRSAFLPHSRKRQELRHPYRRHLRLPPQQVRSHPRSKDLRVVCLVKKKKNRTPKEFLPRNEKSSRGAPMLRARPAGLARREAGGRQIPPPNAVLLQVDAHPASNQLLKEIGCLGSEYCKGSHELRLRRFHLHFEKSQS